MDRYESASSDLISDSPIPIPRAPRSARWSGWLIGAVFGVLASLWAFPSVRYTLTAQFEFATAEDSLPWITSLDINRTAREAPRLDFVATRHPDDYLLQVGRATALATPGAGRPAGKSGARVVADRNDQTLSRLGAVTRLFSTTPGAYAHLARYLMADRIRIQRPELNLVRATAADPANVREAVAPGERSVRIMLWALTSGERLDPDNAFWPAMLATTLFASGQDSEALEALARAARRPRWDAYIYEEVLGQWRLYSAAYGDHGATQKVGPLSLVVFPHLHEIRRMAEMARWHAEHAAEQGRLVEAARIRRNLAHLGVNLRDNARWAYEALYGTDIFFIACTDGDSRMAPGQIRTPTEWNGQATGYHVLLKAIDREAEFRILQSEVETSCDLRKRVDLARYDASYPGIPPGIPLIPLFGNWMAGICLVQEALGLFLAIGAMSAWQRFSARAGRSRIVLRTVALILTAAGTAVSVAVLATSMLTTPRMAGILLTGLTVLSIAGLEAIYRRLKRGRKPREGSEGSAKTIGIREEGTVEDPDTANEAAEPSARWSHGTTIRMLLLIVLPYLAILYTHRGELSGLHPVAILLTSLTGAPHSSGLLSALEIATLAVALPLLLPLASALWALYRGVSPAAGAVTGLRKLALPCLVCLVAAYAVLLNRMLVLDAEASQAIQKAAQNDRQWVLTHGADNPF